MDVDQQNTATKPPGRQMHVATSSQCHARRRIFFLRPRRNKLLTVRLGGRTRKKSQRWVLVVRALKKMKLRCLKLQSTCMVRKMKNYYRDFVKDIFETGSAVETLHQRMFMESTFAVPVMGVPFANYSSATRSYRH